MTASLSLLHIMGSNTLVMDSSKQITYQLPYLQDKNCGGSIDIHFQNGEVTVSLALLLINAANMLVMHNSKHIPFQLPYLHDQESLALS
jgi:hypothetical protein